jgi:hypothetical protein
LLIWYTILEIGRSRKLDVVFVSGDEKADWWHQSENMPLYPRFELVDEFRRASDGRTIFLLSFANLLERFGAPSQVINEVRQEERHVRMEASAAVGARAESRGLAAEMAVLKWITRRSDDAVVEGSDPAADFIVDLDGVRVGYNFCYLRRPGRERLAHELARLRRAISDGKCQSGMIVVVAHDYEAAARISQLIASSSPEPGIAFVVGVLDQAGEFSPRKGFEAGPHSALF